MSEYIIELKDIDYLYPNGIKALSSISLSIRRGAKIAILGANGAGKSTLLLHLNALLKPTKGSFFIDDKEIRYSKKEINDLRRKVGFVFQDPDTQLFSSTVFEELAFGLCNIGLRQREIEDRVREVLKVTNTKHLEDKLVQNLSYGEKKKVCIASVIAMRVSVFVIDEPSAFLDMESRESLFQLLSNMNKSGDTIIFTTHDVDLAYSFADYIFVLDGGQLIAKGATDSIFRIFLGNKLLKMPFVFELFNELKANGFFDNYDDLDSIKLPKNREDIFALLKKGYKKNRVRNKKL